MNHGFIVEERHPQLRFLVCCGEGTSIISDVVERLASHRGSPTLVSVALIDVAIPHPVNHSRHPSKGSRSQYLKFFLERHVEHCSRN